MTVLRDLIIAAPREQRIWQLCSFLLIPFSLSVACTTATGIDVARPWKFLFAVAAVGVPYAYALTRTVLFLNARLTARRALPALGLTLGLLILWCMPRLGEHRLVIFLLFSGFLLADFRQLPRGFSGSTVASLITLALVLGTVCNFNYLLIPHLSARLHDAALIEMDVALYGWLFGRPVPYIGLFPLIESPTGFLLLESAYQTLFAELLIVIVALPWMRRDASRFLRAVCFCCLLGAVVFFVYPAVGPCIYLPPSFRATFHDSVTYHLMQNLAVEFSAATAQNAVNGFAYFIALPSLHTALAVLCQRFLAGSGLLFWTFLPINLLIVLSTVLLGYHYVLDVPAGILLALAAIWVVRGPLVVRDTEPVTRWEIRLPCRTAPVGASDRGGQ